MIRVIHKNGAYAHYWQGSDGTMNFSEEVVGPWVVIADWEAFIDIEKALQEGCRVEYCPDPEDQESTSSLDTMASEAETLGLYDKPEIQL